MEFDMNISKLHGILLSLGNRDVFNKSDLKEAVDALSEIFEGALTDEAKLKMSYFLILNSTLPSLSQLRNDENISFLICTSPAIDYRIVAELIYDLKLQPYFNIIIENWGCAFTVELISAFVEIPKLWKDDAFESLFKIWHSVFIKIHNIHTGHQNDDGCKNLIITFHIITDHIVMIIKESIKDWENKMKLKHLLLFFNEILLLIRIYNNEKYEYEPNEIFKLSSHLKHKNTVKEPSKESIGLLYHSLYQVMEFFTVDLWMFLSECYAESNVTAQVIIGETLYNICEEAKDMPHSYLNNFTNFTIKPKSEIEIMAECDINEIIANIEKGKKPWFKALVSHPQFCKEEILKCIRKYLKLADFNDVDFILNKCFKSILNVSGEESTKNITDIKILFFDTLKYLKEEDYFVWIKRVFDHITPRSIELKTSHDELVKVFNKITTEKPVDIREIANLCIQSPENTLVKICLLGICEANRIDFCINILKRLNCICLFKPNGPSYFSLLECVLWKFIDEYELSQKERNTFVLFVEMLCIENLVTRILYEKIFSLLIMSLKKEQYTKVYFLLEIIKSNMNLKSTFPNKICILVFMSQMLEYFSWDLESFSTIKADIKDLIGGIISSILGTITSKHQISDMDLKWACAEISGCSKMNQAFFYDLWCLLSNSCPSNNSWYSFFLILIHSNLKFDAVSDLLLNLYKYKEPSDVETSMILTLVVLLPTLTRQQWDLLYSKLKSILQNVCLKHNANSVDFYVSTIFSSALFILTLTLNRNKNISNCFKYCLKNFGQILMRSPVMAAKNSPGIFKKLIFILQAISDDEEREMCSLIFSPLLLDLMAKAKENGLGLNKMEIERSIRMLSVNEIEKTIGGKMDNT